MIFVLGFLILGFMFSNASSIAGKDENGNEKNTECTAPVDKRCYEGTYKTSCGITVNVSIGANGKGECIAEQVSARLSALICDAEQRMCNKSCSIQQVPRSNMIVVIIQS